MPGSLIKITETTVSSATASVTLTGIDSTYDVYMVAVNGLSPATAQVLRGRFTESGTENTTANYDFAAKGFKTSASFENNTGVNYSYFPISDSYVNATTEKNFNAIMYIFNASNASEYTFITFETTQYAGAELFGNQGGGVFTVTSSVDGIYFYISGIDIDAGTFSLYGLKK